MIIRDVATRATAFTVAWFLLLAGAACHGAESIRTAPGTLPGLPAPLTDRDFIDFGSHGDARFELGRLLFFDPILSGNQNISCGTCHDPARGTGDGVALSIGEGGVGFGPDRRTGSAVTGRVPRNAQPLYNIGARQYRSFFHDGRLSENTTHVHGTGVVKLDGERLPEDMDSLLTTQAFFPVTSAVEMAGEPGENAIANAVAEYRLSGPDGAWDLLTDRLRRIPEYRARFQSAFPGIRSEDDMQYRHVAQALAAFQAIAFRSTGSRFDALLATGDTRSWSSQERVGLELFYGKAGCADCHTGALLTDHEFHAIAMPQIGPGKGHGTDRTYLIASGFADRLEDEGRYRATLDPDDLFRFRTPSLRNVGLTGPWGHAGAYDSLADAVRHHLDTTTSLHAYDPVHADSLLPPLDHVIDSRGRGAARTYHPIAAHRHEDYDKRRSFVQRSDVLRDRIARANELEPVQLQEDEIEALVEFLHTLTDSASVDQSTLIPVSVPSGLEPQPTPDQNIKQAPAVTRSGETRSPIRPKANSRKLSSGIDATVTQPITVRSRVDDLM